MVAGNIEERIKKMKEAILSEANQRAATIVKNADEEANNERAMLFNQEKEKIHQEFILINKNEKVKDKIQKSAVNNRHRIRRMEARYKYVEKLRDQVSEKLRQIVGDSVRYQEYLQKLIVQGMLRMMERNVNIEVRKGDMETAKGVFSKCQSDFTIILEKETGRPMETHLTISEYSLQESCQKMIGGVFLRSNDGVIVCDNSMDSRVRLVFEHLLPQIRALLFPKQVTN